MNLSDFNKYAEKAYVSMFGNSKRNRNTKFFNLNEKHLAKQFYESSSEEEEANRVLDRISKGQNQKPSPRTKSAYTATSKENCSQTEKQPVLKEKDQENTVYKKSEEPNVIEE